MPHEKDVLEKKWWWCPQWYWPFAVCSGMRTQHKWCYNFSWVEETGYGLWSNLEGCENGKLFTWTRPSFNFFGSHTYPGGEICFNSACNQGGRCDDSRTGLIASGLSPSDPYVSGLNLDVIQLTSDVVETGTFDFSGENKRLCQSGMWPWKRTIHKEMLIVSVVTRFAEVQWYVGGIPLPSNSGGISLNAFCVWPFPLPKGRNGNRVVSVSYSITTEANKSTLKVYNDPNDGTYTLPVGMRAFDNGKQVGSSFSSATFRGETCDFAPEQVEEMLKCETRLINQMREKPRFRKPTPGEPVIVFSDEIWRFAREKDVLAVKSLLEIIQIAFRNDQELFLQAADQLQNILGLTDISQFAFVRATEEKDGEDVDKQLSTVEHVQPLTAALMVAGVVGVGILIGRLTAPSRRLR